jgi:hypothetical protein
MLTALCSLFGDDIVIRLDEANIHSPVINKRHVARLLTADDLTVGATAGVGLLKEINCVEDSFRERSLKINVDKTKELNRDEKWWLRGEEIEIIKEIKYLGMVLDSRGKWGKRGNR